ncbi:hypothetical protein HOLDEFILI_00320 [Holdemania filiformis DSM 12042]|uniref:Uncharacterized protein n=1 Tax=Holdemania filiformis DSM 12042 TaxID=545696 RepID=B9Y3E5_9FIRM|nr:hypothetical protein HOLDEFILI_00320 [Holdemania filiformis DSM 12042]
MLKTGGNAGFLLCERLDIAGIYAIINPGSRKFRRSFSSFLLVKLEN